MSTETCISVEESERKGLSSREFQKAGVLVSSFRDEKGGS